MTNNTDPVRAFRKKPVVIEASQWFKNGDHPLDGDASREGEVVRYFRHPGVPGNRPCQHCGMTMYAHGWIDTLEGGHVVCPGDWIITGVQGEHYPCKPDIFAATYEPVALASAPPSAPVGVDAVLGFLPAPLTHSQAWPQGYVDGFNACAKLAEEQVRIALAQQPAAPSGEAVAWIAQCELDSLAATPEGQKANGLVWSTPTGQAGVPLYAAPQQPGAVDEAVRDALWCTVAAELLPPWQWNRVNDAALAAQQQGGAE